MHFAEDMMLLCADLSLHVRDQFINAVPIPIKDPGHRTQSQGFKPLTQAQVKPSANIFLVWIRLPGVDRYLDDLFFDVNESRGVEHLPRLRIVGYRLVGLLSRIHEVVRPFIQCGIVGKTPVVAFGVEVDLDMLYMAVARLEMAGNWVSSSSMPCLQVFNIPKNICV